MTAPVSQTYSFYPDEAILHRERDGRPVLWLPAVTGEYMDFGNMLGDAFTYTKEGVLGNMNRWLKLILAILCLGLPFNGYILRVYRGADTGTGRGPVGNALC